MRRSWSGSPFCRFRFSFCRENSFSRHSHVSAAGLSQARLSFASWSQFWARAPVRSPRSATRIFPHGVLSARKITPNLFSFPILFWHYGFRFVLFTPLGFSCMGVSARPRLSACCLGLRFLSSVKLTFCSLHTPKARRRALVSCSFFSAGPGLVLHF
jgi:hypothetical protein